MLNNSLLNWIIIMSNRLMYKKNIEYYWRAGGYNMRRLLFLNMDNKRMVNLNIYWFIGGSNELKFK